ncbi:MAG: exodeoxyribonuclease V subunit gamma [Nitrospira sp.]|nr:exodeoxyribonuclease V subunit gamma [Nitrospira sp.]
MLKVVIGRFHPTLESALVERVRRLKVQDPLAPLAIVVPSHHLGDRIRTLLAVEHRLSLLNLHLLTFHQLALRLADERRAEPVPRVVDELFFEQVIRYLVCHRLSQHESLRRLGHTAGTWGALWATIRDLKDALVDPNQMRRGLQEGCFDEDDRDWLEALVALYAAVMETGRTLGVGTRNDLAASLLPSVSTSSFLQPFGEVLYYGFYDLTQVQLSFFEAVSRAKETTLFFPLEDDPAYGFARRFFDRCIRPLSFVVERGAASNRASSAQENGEVRIFLRSVIGPEEELATACRGILELVETNGYWFDEIGVVARTLDPYQAYLRSVFDRHRVPFRTTAARSLMEEPICKLLVQLVSLPLVEWYAPSVLDVVTSPLYKSALFHERSPAYRPEQWKLVVQALRIVRGTDEWNRLDRVSQGRLVLDGEESPLDSLAIAPETLTLLRQVVTELMKDCSTLPSQGTVGRLVEACRVLMDQHLRRLGQELSGTEERASGEGGEMVAWDALDGIWATLRELEPLNEELTWAEFVELLTHTIEKTMVPVSSSCSGVMVSDVMAARGVPFRALFLLGLNDQTFPRSIREDGFLRDRHRRVIDATLGFKIDEKLAAYEEEQLLFHLACRSASHRLVLSYQRADESGRMLAASPYLDEMGRLFGLEEHTVEMVPRRLTERLRRRPAERFLIAPRELIQWLVLNGQDPTDFMAAWESDGETFRHAAKAVGRIEVEEQELNEFDGLTGRLDAHWRQVLEHGIAPTPLERYARCPFQYFAADVLRLETNRMVIEPGPDAALVGTLCHAALRHCYERLVQAGWPVQRVKEDELKGIVASSVERAAETLENRQGVGPYLLWEMAKETVCQLVHEAVEADEAEQAEQPYSPIAFEVEGEGVIPETLGGEPLKIRGRLDRLDRHRVSGALRVIDYKLKLGASMKPEDRNLVLSAVRGYRLQPPLYSCLSVQGSSLPDLVQFFFLAPQWVPSISRSTFEKPSWSSDTGLLIRKTLATLFEGINRGRFFILPDGYCDGCLYRPACRREHGPTWWRAHRAVETKSLKALRKQQVNDE